MSNTTGKINLFVYKINKENAKEQLKKLVSIDGDFEEVAEEIVNEIVAKHTNIKEMIEAVIKLRNHKEVNSTFLLNNETYCSGYDYEITEIDGGVVLSLAYII